nr:lipocalin family protein [uncultured Flavobacterium sp.]
MNRVFFLFLFFAFFSIAQAQNSELIEGKWVFKQALNKGIDKEGRKSLKEIVIDKMTFLFEKNGDFEAYLMNENQRGKWSFKNNSKSIVLDTGVEKFELIILQLTKTRLVLKIGLGEFLMQRI